MSHPRAEHNLTGSWHGVLPEGWATEDGQHAYARSVCERCGQLVEGRGATTEMAELNLSCARVTHHCEPWNVTTHTSREARRVARDWWRQQDASVWRDALLYAAVACVVGLVILRAWSRW